MKKCEHKNCTRDATSNNLQYHPDKWLCTYHANKVVKEGRRKRKYELTIKKQITMNEFEKKIRNKLLMRGFPNDKLLNNRGLIGATIDEVILEVVKNIGVTRCCETFKEEQRRPSPDVEKWMIEYGYKICD